MKKRKSEVSLAQVVLQSPTLQSTALAGAGLSAGALHTERASE